LFRDGGQRIVAFCCVQWEMIPTSQSRPPDGQ
jgi:hypothetical protein